MKFKYNFLERKLWRIEDNYFYEISEENRFINHFYMTISSYGFKLGENHYLVFNSIDFNSGMTACYTKPSKNGETIYYQKQIKKKFPEIETIFEFTEQDQINHE